MRNLLILINSLNLFSGLLYFYIFLMSDLFPIITLRKFWTVQIFLALILLFFDKKNNFLSPNSFFSISVLIFIWSRLLLNIFLNVRIIEVGKGITEGNIFITSIVIGISVTIIILSSLFSEKLNLSNKLFREQNLVLPSILIKTIIFFAVVFALLFICDSYQKINIIKTNSYLKIAESSALLSGIKYFTISKLLVFIWIFLGRRRERFYLGSLILFIGSTGFFMIGLRGYGIIYLFLFLFFHNMKHNLNIVKLIFIFLGLIIFSNFILEYRLNFEVSKGIISTIINTLHSQGASLEPVFGTIIFREEILNTLNFKEYIAGVSFGNYVDSARGVNFKYGGFGSSFFAEAYYLGIPIFITLSIFFGIFLGFLENAYEKILKYNYNKSAYIKIILFMTIPNLIYFARSAALDFIGKFLSTMIIIFILIFILGRFNSKFKLRKDNIK